MNNAKFLAQKLISINSNYRDIYLVKEGERFFVVHPKGISPFRTVTTTDDALVVSLFKELSEKEMAARLKISLE